MLDRFPFRAIVVAAALAAAATARAQDVVELSSGDRLVGAVVEQNDDHVIIEHELLGTVTIPRDRVTAVVSGDQAAAAIAQPLPEPEPPPAPEREWKSRFTFAGNASFGNTDAQGFAVGVTSERITDTMETRLDAWYYYQADDGDRSENRATAGIINDWLIRDSRWSWFAQGRYDYDQFQSWEHRVAAHGGIGYLIVDEDDLSVRLRAGLGAIREFKSDDEDIRLEGLLGAELSWAISESQSLEAAATFYPDLSNFGEFRTISFAGWRAMLDKETNLSLRLRGEHEYQSSVGPSAEHNDFRFVAGREFDF